MSEEKIIREAEEEARQSIAASDRAEFPIIVEGLVNRFGDQLVHDNLSLKVRRGEILGVVGGSGTGKSVLMRSIIGLQMPESGHIEVLGRSMTEPDHDDGVDIRSRWGVLFQGGGIVFHPDGGRKCRGPTARILPGNSRRIPA